MLCPKYNLAVFEPMSVCVTYSRILHLVKSSLIIAGLVDFYVFAVGHVWLVSKLLWIFKRNFKILKFYYHDWSFSQGMNNSHNFNPANLKVVTHRKIFKIYYFKTSINKKRKNYITIRRISFFKSTLLDYLSRIQLMVTH